MTVHFLSVVPRLRCEIILATEKIMSDDPVSCLAPPLTHVTSLSFCGPGTSRGDTMHGPIGAKPSKDFA